MLLIVILSTAIRTVLASACASRDYTQLFVATALTATADISLADVDDLSFVEITGSMFWTNQQLALGATVKAATLFTIYQPAVASSFGQVVLMKNSVGSTFIEIRSFVLGVLLSPNVVSVALPWTSIPPLALKIMFKDHLAVLSSRTVSLDVLSIGDIQPPISLDLSSNFNLVFDLTKPITSTIITLTGLPPNTRDFEGLMFNFQLRKNAVPQVLMVRANLETRSFPINLVNEVLQDLNSAASGEWVNFDEFDLEERKIMYQRDKTARAYFGSLYSHYVSHFTDAILKPRKVQLTRFRGIAPFINMVDTRFMLNHVIYTTYAVKLKMTWIPHAGTPGLPDLTGQYSSFQLYSFVYGMQASTSRYWIGVFHEVHLLDGTGFLRLKVFDTYTNSYIQLHTFDIGPVNFLPMTVNSIEVALVFQLVRTWVFPKLQTKVYCKVKPDGAGAWTTLTQDVY